jgi:4-diphosphocytidyl-2-C-methyl-D-erythritol kinase
MTDQRPHSPEILPARPRRTRLDDGALCLAAPAKINLDLLVGPRQADGFHAIDSIVAKVALYDEVVLRPRGDGRIALQVRGADCGPDADNLAARAARLLADAAGAPGGAGPAGGRGVEIFLSKFIPPGMGLGGGSSDAAAVLDGLNELWQLAIPADRLAELAAQLGSDVPLFLGPPAARMTGRGERLEPVTVHPFIAVLHMPQIACSTADVYRQFDRLPGAGRPIAEREAMDLAGSPPSAWRGRMRNDLALAAYEVSAELRRLALMLRRTLRQRVALTGTGSALFVLCDDARHAGKVLRRLPPDLPGRTVLVRPSPC